MKKQKPRFYFNLSEGEYAIINASDKEVELYIEEGELKIRECKHDLLGNQKEA